MQAERGGKSFLSPCFPFGKTTFYFPHPLSRSLAARAKIEMGVTRRGGGGGEEGQEMKAEGPEEEEGRGEGRGGQKKFGIQEIVIKRQRKASKGKNQQHTDWCSSVPQKLKKYNGKKLSSTVSHFFYRFLLIEGKPKPRLLLPISSSLPSVSA